MHRITPFLWFDGQAEEAVEFYTAGKQGPGSTSGRSAFFNSLFVEDCLKAAGHDSTKR